jgi:hypothetical protein
LQGLPGIGDGRCCDLQGLPGTGDGHCCGFQGLPGTGDRRRRGVREPGDGLVTSGKWRRGFGAKIVRIWTSFLPFFLPPCENLRFHGRNAEFFYCFRSLPER